MAGHEDVVAGTHTDSVLGALIAQRVRIAGLVARRSVEVLREWMLATGIDALRVDMECSVPEDPFDELDGLTEAVGNAPPKLFREIPHGNGDMRVTLADLNECLKRPVDDREPLAVTTDVPTPRIEVIVVRDPDSASEVSVVADGRLLAETDVEEHHVDAGAGYEWEDWCESRDAAVASASAAAARLLGEAFDDPPGAEHVLGAPAGWPSRG